MELRQQWEIEASVAFVTNGGYRTVVLQFPDDLLGDSAAVAEAFTSECEDGTHPVEVFVLADSAYDSLSTDEVAANHVKADCVIHYGPASMAPACHLPTFFVFPAENCSPSECSEYVSRNLPEWIDGESTAAVLFLDQALQHYRQHIASNLGNAQSSTPLIVAETVPRTVQPRANECGKQSACTTATDHPEANKQTGHSFAGMRWSLPDETLMCDCVCVWIGDENSQTLFQLSLRFSTSKWVLVDPAKLTSQIGLPIRTTQLLRRRYYLVEKARSAQIVGILVSTLAVGGFLAVTKRLKQLAGFAGKKTYMVVIGKPTPAKLANFPEVEVFVMVSDPTSMILDSKEFMAPIITPYEAQMAFSGGTVNPGEYRYAMTDQDHQLQMPASEEPHFSLVDGSLQVLAQDPLQTAAASALAVRNENNTIAKVEGVAIRSAADYFVSKRNFKGMDADVGSDVEVGEVSVGRKGRAAGYVDEPVHQDKT
ncbi:hypothetical protein BSKO_01938 [Bryopsis sp. KO-2023]|nr:hypothetical protein BSKO_01938 [Bryopsis sp. KO-2023]